MEEGQPAATQIGQPAAIQKSEDCTHCGGTHPTVSSAGSGGSCSEKGPEPTTPQRAQRHTEDEYLPFLRERAIMEMEFQALGFVAPAPCLEAEESPSKRRAVIPSTIMDVAKLHFFDMEAVLCCLRTWIHYEDFALCSLRTCNRTLMKFVATVNSSSKNFIKACLMQMRIHIRCPRPIRDWTPLTAHCSSPFCRGNTGYITEHPTLGLQTIQRWVTEHSEPYVVCSVPCYARVKHLLKLRHEPSCGLVVAVTDYVPAIYV